MWPFSRRKRYNGDVAAILPALGVDMEEAGVMKLLNVLDIAWFDEQGQVISPDAWNNPHERTLVLRRAAADADGKVPILTCLFNPTPEDRAFKLPPPRLATRLLLDSADPAGPERDIVGDSLSVQARSVVLLRSVYRP